jgi:replicative DNA helicase
MADYIEYTPEAELPYNLEAEQSVLGAVLVEPSCIAQALELLRPESFYRPEHIAIFDIMMRLFTTAQPVDYITVLEIVQRENVFENPADARAYLPRLIEMVPSVANLEAYARIVREKHDIRRLMTAAREIIEDSRTGAADAQTLMDSAEQKIYDIRQGRDGAKLTRIDAVIYDIYETLQRLAGEDRDKYLGIRTGFSELDKITTGLNRSDLILLAARPGVGKTSFALNIATNVAQKGTKVAIFSLEMGKEQLGGRILSSLALIQGKKLRTGELSPEDFIHLADAAAKISKAPIYIDDTAAITVPEMKARLRRVKDLGLVVIDYLQLMSSPTKSDNRVQVVSEITRSLKIMAKELNVPILVLSQLSRDMEKRSNHKPMLSDLRESGSIEQDADIVIFLYSKSNYDGESEDSNVIDCIVAKNRHGETETVRLGWDGEYTRFTGLEVMRHT